MLDLGSLGFHRCRNSWETAAQDTVFAHAHNSFFDCGSTAGKAHALKSLSTVREVSDSAVDLASTNLSPGLAEAKVG